MTQIPDRDTVIAMTRLEVEVELELIVFSRSM